MSDSDDSLPSYSSGEKPPDYCVVYCDIHENVVEKQYITVCLALNLTVLFVFVSCIPIIVKYYN